MANDEVVVFGASGHAKVVIATLQSAGHKVVAVYDDDDSKWGKTILEIPISGPLESFEKEFHGCSLFIAVGDNASRKKVTKRFPDFNWINAIHANAYVHESVSLGVGVLICAGAVVQPDSSIGSHAILNTSATVDHDCKIENFCHLAPGVHLAGEVTVGEGCLLGVGTSVRPRIKIGAWALTGVGSAVVKNIETNERVAGVPAEPI